MRVREGSASVKTDKEARAVPAGGTIAVDKTGAISTPAPDAVETAVGWTDGRVTINAPLKGAIAQMKRWWGLELYLKDPAIGTRPVTMNASLDSPKEAI